MIEIEEVWDREEQVTNVELRTFEESGWPLYSSDLYNFTQSATQLELVGCDPGAYSQPVQMQELYGIALLFTRARPGSLGDVALV